MVEQLRPRDLHEWVRAQGGDALILDVREAAELQAASIKAAGFELVHIPMNAIPGRLSQLDPGRAVACLCHHGARSQQVAMFLAAQGFERVANIAGGIDAWSRELDPSVPRY